MDTCTIEVGLLRKSACGHAAVARCLNCEQPLCARHAVAQLSDTGKKTGKFMCAECVAAQKEHARSLAAVARREDEEKMLALVKGQMAGAATPKTPSRPGATPAQPAASQPAPAAEPEKLEALEFTPKDGKFGYTPKKNEPGYKGD